LARAVLKYNRPHFLSLSFSLALVLELTLALALALSLSPLSLFLGHKNTNVHFFVGGKTYNGAFLGISSLRSGQFRGQKVLCPLEKSFEMPHYMCCLRKQNGSCIFRISDTLIVIIRYFKDLMTTEVCIKQIL
jgi:hypothetical protein